MNGDHDAYLKHRCWVSDTTKIRTCETNTNNTSSGNPISTHLATYTKARYQNWIIIFYQLTMHAVNLNMQHKAYPRKAQLIQPKTNKRYQRNCWEWT